MTASRSLPDRPSLESLRKQAKKLARDRSLSLRDAQLVLARDLIVGNADAHGKNFSLLYQPVGVSLAPLYDLLSTVAYADLSPNLAMKIAKRATLEEIGPTTWTAFAEDIGSPVSFVRRRVRELSDAVSSQVPRLPDSAALTGLYAPALKEYAALVASRVERLIRTITT